MIIATHTVTLPITPKSTQSNNNPLQRQLPPVSNYCPRLRVTRKMIIRINILITSHGTAIRSSEPATPKKLFKPAYKTQINPKPFKVLKNRRKMFKNLSLPLMQSTSSLPKTNTHKLGIKGPLVAARLQIPCIPLHLYLTSPR